MEESVEPIRKQAVADQSDIWSLSELVVGFFIFGLLMLIFAAIGSFCLFVPLNYWLPNLSGKLNPPVYIVLIIGLLCFSIFVVARYQSTIRTIPRAMVAGAAFGLGPFGPIAIPLLVGAFRETLYLLLLALGVSVSFALLFAVFIALLNKLRPPKPIQDGTICAQCGYSLIGNTSGICPECGDRDVPLMLVRTRKYEQ
jgi:hypothetical protein